MSKTRCPCCGVKAFDLESTITVLDERNPKKKGSKAYKRWTRYNPEMDGMTVSEAFEAGIRWKDLVRDFKNDIVHIDPNNLYLHSHMSLTKAEYDAQKGS